MDLRSTPRRVGLCRSRTSSPGFIAGRGIVPVGEAVLSPTSRRGEREVNLVCRAPFPGRRTRVASRRGPGGRARRRALRGRGGPAAARRGRSASVSPENRPAAGSAATPASVSAFVPPPPGRGAFPGRPHRPAERGRDPSGGGPGPRVGVRLPRRLGAPGPARPGQLYTIPARVRLSYTQFGSAIHNSGQLYTIRAQLYTIRASGDGSARRSFGAFDPEKRGRNATKRPESPRNAVSTA